MVSGMESGRISGIERGLIIELEKGTDKRDRRGDGQGG
jgi:hypothetical protein